MPKADKPWERRENESAKAYEAFSLYLGMGAERGLRAVGQKLGKSRAIIERWSRTHQWVDRCRAWDSYLREAEIKAAVEEYRHMSKRHIQIALQLQTAVMSAFVDPSTGKLNSALFVTDKNMITILKFATELERQNREGAAFPDVFPNEKEHEP